MVVRRVVGLRAQEPEAAGPGAEVPGEVLTAEPDVVLGRLQPAVCRSLLTRSTSGAALTSDGWPRTGVTETLASA